MDQTNTIKELFVHFFRGVSRQISELSIMTAGYAFIFNRMMWYQFFYQSLGHDDDDVHFVIRNLLVVTHF